VLVTISGRVLSAANEDIPAENRHAEHGKVARTFMETRTSAESALCGTWGATRPRKPVMSTANHRQATYTSTAPRMSWESAWTPCYSPSTTSASPLRTVASQPASYTNSNNSHTDKEAHHHVNRYKALGKN